MASPSAAGEQRPSGSGTAISWPLADIAHEARSGCVCCVAAPKLPRLHDRPPPRAACMSSSSAFTPIGVEAREALVEAAHDLVADRRAQEADRAADARAGRHQHPARCRAFSGNGEACTGPPPPNAISGAPTRRFCRFSIACTRAALAMFSSTISTTPRAAIAAGSPSAQADMCGQRIPRRQPASSAMAAAGETLRRVVASEGQVGVGHRRGACRRARSRPALGSAPALLRPHGDLAQRGRSAASEPPPAPISTISTTGMRSGRPEPFLNRPIARHLEAAGRLRLRFSRRSGRFSPWCRPCRTTAPGPARIGGRCARRRSRRPAGPLLHQANRHAAGGVDRGEAAAGQQSGRSARPGRIARRLRLQPA